MTDKEKLEAIRAEIHRLVDVRGYDRGMANDLFAFMDSLPNELISSIWHNANEKSNEPEEVVIINPSDNTGEVATRCVGVYQGRIWAYTSELLKLYNPCKIEKNKKEEPISEDLEIAANEWDLKASFTPFYMALDSNGNPYEVRQNYTTHAESFKAGAQWQKVKDESPTKDLGEYINKLSKQFPEVSFAKLSRIAVRVAKWQKAKDQSTIELAEDHAMLAGMEKMKEQMMAKAVETTFNVSLPCGVYDKLKAKGCEDGDKLLIIKKEE